MLNFNNERKCLFLIIAIRHRSLSGVENKIFEVEYLIKIFSTVLAPHFLIAFGYLKNHAITREDVQAKDLEIGRMMEKLHK